MPLKCIDVKHRKKTCRTTATIINCLSLVINRRRGHSVITFALRGGGEGEGDPSKCEHMQTGGGDVTSMRMFAYRFF